MDSVANPFSDGELPVGELAVNSNPYCSPVATRSGWWDKTLLRRIVRAWAFIGVWFIFMDLVIFLRCWRIVNHFGTGDALETLKYVIGL